MQNTLQNTLQNSLQNTLIAKTIATELGIPVSKVEATIKLIDEGNTIPFIARYRKEVTGSLNDEVLRELNEKLTYLRNLEDRKEHILKSIEDQNKLTDKLKEKIVKCTTLVELEDLYLPYKQKKRTRATIAKEKGLEPLANLILFQAPDFSPVEESKKYIDEEKDITDSDSALNMACDIIAEFISDNADYRSYIRDFTFKNGAITSSAKDKETESVYEMYYDFSEAVNKIAGHRVLAINRGEKEKILSVKITVDTDRIHSYLEKQIINNKNEECKKLLTATIEDSYKRLIAPAIEREIRNSLTETAEDNAIKVFGKNLGQLLMQPPIAGKTVLGWDPAFRTGCKLAVVSPTGKILDTTVIFPTAPQNKIKEATEVVLKLVKKYGIELISLGNGTASRESEQVITDIIKQCPTPLSYIITNEAGASVYSASKLATEELPDYDVGQRSSASIARRVQDPLAELVKIDPKAIGVGQYQHDMNQKKLENSLTGVVENCVNSVGVDLNTASAPLLGYIAGISPAIAKNIVSYREENGSFHNRKELLKVNKLGPKAFEQCAGFLRINGGDNPLDYTGVHPESYDAVKKLLNKSGSDLEDLKSEDTRKAALSKMKLYTKNMKQAAADLEIGTETLKDIIDELEKPGRDPRESLPKPILKSDVMEMSQLKEGMILKGTVRNVIDFGAFVDIGVHQDGLVHISQITNKYIKHPLDVLNVGDVVDVMVLSVDEKKGRISLTMKGLPS